MNWFILLLIPFVALPVVLLYGFSGCGKFDEEVVPADAPPAPVASTVPKAPFNLIATPLDTATIRLAWQDNNGGGVNFWIGRLRPNGTWDDQFVILGNQYVHDVGNLAAGESHTYRIYSELSGVLSAQPSNQVTAKTLEWKKAFDNAGLAAANDQNFKGSCLVQRIDKALLTAAGSKVRVTLRAGNNVLNVDLVTISAPATAGGAALNPWDSAPPVAALGPVSIPANGTQRLGPVDFAFDKTQDVLVAFDIGAANGATRKVATTIGASTAYIHNTIAEAIKADRLPTNYNPKPNTVYLVETIEVLSV